MALVQACLCETNVLIVFLFPAIGFSIGGFARPTGLLHPEIIAPDEIAIVMPPGFIGKLSAVVNEALKTEDVQTALKRQGTNPPGSTPKEFADFIRADIGKWAAVLRSAELRK